MELSPKYKAEMNARLKNAGNMAEMFKILGEYYDLENCKPGPIVKNSMIHALQTGVKMVRATPKPFYAK